jgi:hypothetical protein
MRRVGCFRPRGASDGRPDLSSARHVPHAAIKVTKMLAHLVEREPKGESALHGVDREA